MPWTRSAIATCDVSVTEHDDRAVGPDRTPHDRTGEAADANRRDLRAVLVEGADDTVAAVDDNVVTIGRHRQPQDRRFGRAGDDPPPRRRRRHPGPPLFASSLSIMACAFHASRKLASGFVANSPAARDRRACCRSPRVFWTKKYASAKKARSTIAMAMATSWTRRRCFLARRAAASRALPLLLGSGRLSPPLLLGDVTAAPLEDGGAHHVVVDLVPRRSGAAQRVAAPVGGSAGWPRRGSRAGPVRAPPEVS